MYFDAVLRKGSPTVVLFNGTPEETKTYLRDLQAPHDDLQVVKGENLRNYEVEEYLNL